MNKLYELDYIDTTEGGRISFHMLDKAEKRFKMMLVVKHKDVRVCLLELLYFCDYTEELENRIKQYFNENGLPHNLDYVHDIAMSPAKGYEDSKEARWYETDEKAQEIMAQSRCRTE